MDSRQEYTIYFAAKTSATELKAELSQSVALRVFAFYKKATESSCTKMTAVYMYRTTLLPSSDALSANVLRLTHPIHPPKSKF